MRLVYASRINTSEEIHTPRPPPTARRHWEGDALTTGLWTLGPILNGESIRILMHIHDTTSPEQSRARETRNKLRGTQGGQEREQKTAFVGHELW